VGATALGDSPTVTCPLRELSTKAANQERPAVEKADIPEFLDRICQQHSVSFTKADTLRQKQAFPFMSPEWDEFHDHARQSIESCTVVSKTKAKSLSPPPDVDGCEASPPVRSSSPSCSSTSTCAPSQSFSATKSKPKPKPDRVRADAIVRRRDRVWDNPYTKTTALDSILDIAARGELESPLRT
jgi:hypothetical protein